ncbi:membrane protein [Mycobacterium tuberculosis M2442]|uniref:hypothetical protein n=1 Tax=Mycobacterium tuberculosis TaxID=1773 RepID=UPI00045AB49F|nr:hypothetical protein [Mycobacterium tuberculosis]KAM09965.1 membrane protein [Mycobacterium tuberculosis M2352]KAY02719.1 membrane protein [Mycobacterium tuberculosis M1221]KAZ76851.1 membrane protein [Mycobacterium tuberculosis M1429]KBA41387.1 membrane protein [Mycobacterium tuberculosis M1520]KBA87667.1 membrane protein [Mycobacterium tuberculosis M1726]
MQAANRRSADTICGVTAPAPLPIPRTRSWPAIVVAAIAAVVAVAALIVALTNARPAATPSVPTYTAAQTAAAQRQLCDTYKLVAHAVPVDTNGSDKALARITLTNAAAILDNAAADPALDAKHRDAARASDRLPHNDRNGEWWHSS